MAKIWLDWSDGRYSTRLLTDEEAADHESKDLDVVHLEDNVWEAYLRHCDRDATWQVLWRSISNEQSMRRREKELMPLEDAAREITRLRDALARARRMARYFEDEWSRASGIIRRQSDGHAPRSVDPDDRDEWICVFPQPGCDVDALPIPWRERAREILASYDQADADEGIKRQGCCCGHEHLRLDDDATARLRAAGFIVEHDSESESR